MPNPLRVAFMTTLGRNVGDEFIREGIRSFFDDVLGGAYEPLYVDKHDLETLHRRVMDESIDVQDKFRDADVIVQAGAPVYWANGRFRSYNVEWAQALWFDRIFKLGSEKTILNLGAGAGQKSEDDIETLLADPQLIDFAEQAGRACAWTTARDPLASQFLRGCNVEHELLPCPAFHAARRVVGRGSLPKSNNLLAVNFMPKAGHYRLKPETDEAKWCATINELLPMLRKDHKLLFVAHDQAEAQFHRTLAHGDESIFFSHDYRDYMALFSRVKGIFANRVHAAVCVAGFGRPAVIVGNDARIGIARPIGIPAKDSSQATAHWIEDELQQQFAESEKLSRRRIALREESAHRYVSRIRELLERSVQAKAA
jgi:hypothetical protein